MSDQIWSWFLGGVGLVGFFLAGRRLWWAWYINLANQVVWIVYSLLTQQYGFLVTAILYTVIFANNALKWTRARHQQTEKEHGSITEGSRDP